MRALSSDGPRFGVLTFQAMPFADLLEDVQFAERAGLDAVWLADQMVPDSMPVLEAWTALAALAVSTTRIRIGTLITNAALRNAMLLARQALTVDQVAHGRVDLGLGAGYYADDHRWLGIDYLDAKGRAQRLTEVAEVLDRALRGERVTYDGSHVRLEDAPSMPPSQHPRMPLWIAVLGSTSMRLAARLADGAAFVGDAGASVKESLPRLAERIKQLHATCSELDRQPASLRCAYLAGFAHEPVFSSRDATVDFVGRFAAVGVTEFVFPMAHESDGAFADDVASGRFATRAKLERLVEDLLPAQQ